jgi:hypothetical protein
VKGKGEGGQRLSYLPDDRSIKAVQGFFTARKRLSVEHYVLLLNASNKRIATQGIAKVVVLTAESAAVSICSAFVKLARDHLSQKQVVGCVQSSYLQARGRRSRADCSQNCRCRMPKEDRGSGPPKHLSC